MSLFSALTASVSGMAAQANKLSTVSDNIANSDTTGYKQAMTEFENLISQAGTSSYNASGVATVVRYNISEHGNLKSTTSSTDLAIQGNGFFLVGDANGSVFLTRAGNFKPDATGNLVNAAGFTLLGYSASSGNSSSAGLSGLEPVNIFGDGLKAVPSTTGKLTANLNSNADIVTGSLPSANVAGSVYTSKTSLVTYDNLGNAVKLDVYYSKTGTNTWEASIYNAADAAPGGGFPYSGAALATQTLNFSASDGSLTGQSSISLSVPGGANVAIDLSGTTQLASAFEVSAATTNGNAPSAVQSVSISPDGTLSEVFVNGTQKAIFTIPLATVASVDNMTSLAGDVFSDNSLSGPILVGDPGLGGFGSIQSEKLESSTVDLASQLTDMIVAQRSYESNSKVFQTGSELLSTLNNMLK
ncbi:flagellar basal body FlaE domain protein [Methylocella silvestris BL2]|uniref:Flagellar hook protein FlgE n=1 Tax=Methylocella silvestris (strain DSM 15510 / CIP 108128 / LMG 27833 / NCIMB 13906 / BL2) TaxID=395965 RepID=B8EL30_METSB|nr:flagellar hook protein FlgE [Methylocella silvestris]ACK49025.1 flagellar basal body FlaE domain protein [Methylocella silvestris BL2]